MDQVSEWTPVVHNKSDKSAKTEPPIVRRWERKRPELTNSFSALQELDEQEFPELEVAATSAKQEKSNRLQAPRLAKKPNPY